MHGKLCKPITVLEFCRQQIFTCNQIMQIPGQRKLACNLSAASHCQCFEPKKVFFANSRKDVLLFAYHFKKTKNTRLLNKLLSQCMWYNYIINIYSIMLFKLPSLYFAAIQFASIFICTHHKLNHLCVASCIPLKGQSFHQRKGNNEILNVWKIAQL